MKKHFLKKMIIGALLCTTTLFASEDYSDINLLLEGKGKVSSSLAEESEEFLFDFNEVSLEDISLLRQEGKTIENNYKDEMTRLVVYLQNLSLAGPEIEDILIHDEMEKGCELWSTKGLGDFWSFRSMILHGVVETPSVLPILQQAIPNHLVQEESWSRLKRITEKKSLQEQSYPSSIPRFFTEEKTLDDLLTASKAIDNLGDIQDGDTLVGVGNTPQFILEMHKKQGRKKLNYLQIPLSGAPDMYKKSSLFWFESILTKESLENYRNYLSSVGFLNQKHQGRLIFIDIIGSGHGPAFLIKEYKKNNPDFPSENIILLGINHYDDWSDKAKTIKVKNLSLDMSFLANKLDRIPDNSNSELRFMPHFPACNWADPFSEIPFPHGKIAQELVEKIHSFQTAKSDIQDRYSSYDASLFDERDSDHLNFFEKKVYLGYNEEVKKQLLEMNPPKEKIIDIVATTIIREDNLEFCAWAVKAFDLNLNDIPVSSFDRECTLKEQHIEMIRKRLAH